MSKLRLPKNNKPYWETQLKLFSDLQIAAGAAAYIEYGKRDIRGVNSICWYTTNHGVSRQEFFESRDMMLGYIQGYIAGKKRGVLKS